jgi:hypothetical protein
MSGLQTVIMPGVTVIPYQSIQMQFYGCGVLKTVVVGESFEIESGEWGNFTRVFHNDDKTVGYTDLYVSSANGSVEIFSPNDRNRMLSGDVYYYSEIDCVNTGKYVDGNIVKSEVAAHVGYKDGLCTACGANQTVGVKYAINDDGETASVVGYTGSATEVYVAGTYLGKPVMAVKGCAFWTHGYPNTGKTNNSNITKIVLPNSVTELGGSCFRGQLNLTTVIAPGVTLIDTSIHSDMQFHDCYNLSTVVFGKTISIKNNQKRVFSCYNAHTYAGVNILLSEGGDGTVGIVASSCGADSSNYNRMLSLDRIYVYSSNRPADEALATTWCYVDGVPTLWSNVPVAE